MASFGLLFASIVLAVLFHFAMLCFPCVLLVCVFMLCFPCVLLLEVSLAVSLGSSSARTGDKWKSSEPQCGLVWSHQKVLTRESLFRIWRRDFL